VTDELDALLEIAEGHARAVLVAMKEAELMPTFVMIADGETLFAPTPWRDARDKARYLGAVRALMKERGVTRYSMVSEAWTAKQPDGWKPGMPVGALPGDRPDRKEVVIAIAADKTNTKSRTWDIVRGESGAVVELRLDKAGGHDLSGRMAELLRHKGGA
jgi:hypothetical protein